MAYIPNPKIAGSGIVCCIPQTGICPVGCEDCFFQSGRSYLEPLDENLPNMPSLKEVGHRIVRVNDGNDSNNDREAVMKAVSHYPLKFYNTSIPKDLEKFDAPVVLTVNPGKKTDVKAVLLDPIPDNLMFVRVRTNTWNIFEVVDPAVQHYSSRKVPVILTFMAYYTGSIPGGHFHRYSLRKRTMNSYQAITTSAWEWIMDRYFYSKWVYSCGKIEGERGGIPACHRCGNCLREFFYTMERLAA